MTLGFDFDVLDFERNDGIIGMSLGQVLRDKMIKNFQKINLTERIFRFNWRRLFKF